MRPTVLDLTETPVPIFLTRADRRSVHSLARAMLAVIICAGGAPDVAEHASPTLRTLAAAHNARTVARARGFQPAARSIVAVAHTALVLRLLRLAQAITAAGGRVAAIAIAVHGGIVTAANTAAVFNGLGVVAVVAAAPCLARAARTVLRQLLVVSAAFTTLIIDEHTITHFVATLLALGAARAVRVEYFSGRA